MEKNFYDVLKNRRSIYHIDDNIQIEKERIISLIQEVQSNLPSAFNSQSSRLLLLFGKKHNQLWDIVIDTVRPMVPEESLLDTESKIKALRAGYGTVLFFDDTSVTTAYAERFPLYRDNFVTWANHTNGMLQYMIWTTLTAEGLGATLHHYNPLIDEAVKKAFQIPDSWSLAGQMPFGNPLEPAGNKEVLPADEVLKVLE